MNRLKEGRGGDEFESKRKVARSQDKRERSGKSLSISGKAVSAVAVRHSD